MAMNMATDMAGMTKQTRGSNALKGYFESLRRPPTEWIIRVGLLLALAWIGCVIVLQSWAIALPSDQLVAAHRLAPRNARIAAALSEQLSGGNATAADRVRAASLAQDALQRDPMVVEAVTTRGLDALLRQDEAGARRLFAYSQLLSRRDLRTQLWAIEDAVSRGDVGSALQHYDIALRTKRDASLLLFPVLSEAVADPEVRTGLIRTLASQPSWTSGFVDYVVGHGTDAQAALALLEGLARVHIPISEGVNAAIVRRLIAAGQFESAWRYYASIRKGVDRRIGRDPRFTVAPESPAPFDWVPTDDTGASASIQPAKEGGIFDFATSPAVGGILLQQAQLLPAGRYAVAGHSIGIDQPDVSLPYWEVTCGDGRSLARSNISRSSEGNGNFSGLVIVPEGCPSQTLSLVARPSDAIGGVQGQIDYFALRPLANQ